MKNLKYIYILFFLFVALGCDKEEVIINKGPLFLGDIVAMGTDPDSGEDVIVNLAPGMTKIPLDASFTIEFSKPASNSTLSSIYLVKGNDPVAANVTATGNSVTLTPNADLEVGEKYSLILDESLRAEDGGLYYPYTSITFRALGYQFEDQVAYWAFEENMIDSVSELVGSVKAATFTPGLKGNALTLDVANQSYATFNPSATVTGMGSFSVSLWVNPTFVDADDNNGIDGVLGLFSLANPSRFWGNISLFVENGSNPELTRMRIRTTNVTSDLVIGDVNELTGFFDGWTNHMVIYDASISTLKYYYNGVLTGSAVATWEGEVSWSPTGPVIFGCTSFMTTPSSSSAGSQGWASYLTGQIDEVRVFNKPLSDAEILNLYNAEKP